MKKFILLLLMAALSGCYGKRPPIKTGLEGKVLPSFNILLNDSNTFFNTNNIPVGKSVVLYYFSPECPYCRAQMEEIVEHTSSLRDIRFYVFTSWPFSEMKRFYEHYQLERYPNIVVGVDYSKFFVTHFRAQGIPYMAIYGRDKKLKEVFMGNVYADQIKDAAQN
jgi:hypothetical protein